MRESCFWALCLLVSLLLAAGLTVACGDDEKRARGESCEKTTDCEEGLTCLGSRCREVIDCVTHEDCPAHMICIIAQGICADDRPPINACWSEEDCAPGFECYQPSGDSQRGGQCIPSESDPDGDDPDGGETDEEGDGGTWTDSTSSLTWQNPPAKAQMGWEEAKNYCKQLKLEGLSDWRLPTITELRSLIRGCPETEIGGRCAVQDDGCLIWRCTCRHMACLRYEGPANGCYLPDELGEHCGWGHWSSSLVEDSPSDRWCVSFRNGHVYPYWAGKTPLDVRCVRGESSLFLP